MGCASSKQKQTRCKNCQTPYSRSYSVPVHHPASHKGDSYHVVALTSSTLGSLPADSDDEIHISTPTDKDSDIIDNKSKEFLTEVLQAKNWSNMIEEKIPKVIPRTPIRTPPGEPETINAWEMMEGLDDCSPLRLVNLDRSFSFHAISKNNAIDRFGLQENDIDSPTMGNSKTKLLESVTESPTPQALQMEEDDSVTHLNLHENERESPNPELLQMGVDDSVLHLRPQENGTESPKQQWLQENGRESPEPQWMEDNGTESPKPEWLDDDLSSPLNPIISDFDPEIVSQFRKALEELSPVATTHLKSPERERSPFSRESPCFSKKLNDMITPTKCPPRGEDKVVIYFTSLRGVRKTYEDCCHVRLIFKGFGVRVDERDVSMHYGFREELKELLEEVGSSGGLPRVFVKGRYIGGAEEIRQLNEDGKLEKLVESCGKTGDGDCFGACDLCGDVRFVPCESCSGSCKIYCEEEGDDWEGEEGLGEFQRCPDCNENGIVRCPVCCD